MTARAPGYLALYDSGELERRADALERRLAVCDICPRECGAERLAGARGECHSGWLPVVASYCDHHGEEPAVSGSRGSGTIFFGNCSMACVYCQNHQISQDYGFQQDNEVSVAVLADSMLKLQEKRHCHNINLVTPTHFAPQIIRALLMAVEGGLELPLVYNTSSYDSVETLKLLDGIVDIYLADLRYAEDGVGAIYSGVPDYATRARAAIREMFRQVSLLETDDAGVAKNGLVVRHLILPGGLAGSRESLAWLAGEISQEVAVSIMAQYYPAHRAREFSELARGITEEEYLEVMQLAGELGLENGWAQGTEAHVNYRPDFDREGHPFKGDV
ncbi:radical SAM protein [Chloroflexota bacterium]